MAITVRDNKVDRHRCADVEDAAMDSLPVENILRPAILGPRHNSEHVLQAERNAGPVMGHDLRHRYNKIRIQNGPGKPQVFHTRVRGARRHFAQLIPIQINKVDLLRLQLIFQTALNEDQVRVPLVARSFSHDHTLGTEAQKCLSGGAYENWICVHLNAGDAFDEIGFEQDRLVIL
jgi:hypothetical protein